jgi:hypothetical protein
MFIGVAYSSIGIGRFASAHESALNLRSAIRAIFSRRRFRREIPSPDHPNRSALARLRSLSEIGIQHQESNIVSDRVRITWAHLHEKIWSRPMTTLPEEFGVSGRSLAKSASAFDIPVPPRGY